VTQDLIELLDRQFEFLLLQKGAAFLRELRRTVEVLQREPRLSALLDDERRSALTLIKHFEEQERHFTQQLVALRNDLAMVAPELDDSRKPRPAPDFAPDKVQQWLRTFAAFDAIANGERLFVPWLTDRDRGPVSSLFAVLHHKINEQVHRSEIFPIQQRFKQLQHEYDEAWSPFYDRVLTQSGARLLYVEDLVARLSRSWSNEAKRSPRLERITEFLRLPTEHSFRDLLYGRIDDENKKEAEAKEHITELQAVVKRIHQGLRLRIGTTRWLLAPFNRFRARCQFHDRERLIALAKHPPRSVAQRARDNQRGKAEQVLTEELARYLFDQGLNPLTEVPAAGLRPDVIDPGSLYVEAKQYGGPRNPRSYLLQGARQVHETMGRLHGSRLQVHEAFYVVFRLGGRRVDLPNKVPCGDWTLYPLLIDLAPASESGSRARKPIVISADELRPRTDASPA
jgi:hypothetical protein